MHIELKYIKNFPISVIFGILAVAIYCTATFLSSLSYPGYNPMDNWLSDLGSFKLNPGGAMIYNVGCMLSGICYFPFFLGFNEIKVEEKFDKILLRLIQFFGFAVGISVFFIGVFHGDLVIGHAIFSMAIFIALQPIYIIAPIFLIRWENSTNLKTFVIVYGLIVAAINVALLYVFTLSIMMVAKIHIVEWFAIFSSDAFTVLISCLIYQEWSNNK